MRRHPPAVIALVLSAMSVLLIVAGLGLTWTFPDLLAQRYDETLGVHVADAIGSLGFPFAGAIVAYRQPDHRYGWLLISLGLTIGLMHFAGAYGALGVMTTPRLPLAELAAWLSSVLWISWLIHLPFVLLVFPDGRLPSNRWLWLRGWLPASPR